MKRRVKLFISLFLLLLLIVTVALSYLQPSSIRIASAAYSNTKSFPIGGIKPYGLRNVAGGIGNLTYQGGPVMTGTSNTYLIFWIPTGTFVSSQYGTRIKEYFHDVGGSPLYHNNTQYTDFTGKAAIHSVYAGQYVDQSSYPANPMTDIEVQAEVTKAMNAKSWTSSIHNIFFVFTAAGEHNVVGDTNNFCAYHSAFGANTIYAAMMYPTVLPGCLLSNPTPSGDQDADTTVNFSSHEQMEAATDPLLNAWFDTNLGGEIGDKCDFVFGVRGPNGSDMTLNKHLYIVQKEWDNAKSACVLKGP